MAGTFGVGTPFTHPTPAGPWGISPYGAQGLNINPFALQQIYGQPFGSFPTVPAFGNPYGAQPLQQAVQLLQQLPQQLQQLEYLEQQQLQQLQQVQQLVQLIPHQLTQLQQLIQSGSRQIQPVQPFGQLPGLGSSSTLPWGGQPQAFGTQPGQVM
jgi:hypothetical protein